MGSFYAWNVTQPRWRRRQRMAEVNLSLLPWQEKVHNDPARFKVIAAGRRCGKTHYAAVTLILAALDGNPGGVMYVGPTMGLARDLMWDKLFELAGEIIVSSNVNNLEIVLAGGGKIALKGSDRPDTLRGYSLKHLVLDEFAFHKDGVFDTILRPALADRKGTAIFISTPEGRNQFYDVYMNGETGKTGWASWHLTSFDNPLLDPEEIQNAKETMPGWMFRQEFQASFDAKGSEFFDPEAFIYYDKKPDIPGDYYIAVDLAGFESERGNKTKRRDNSAMAVVFVTDEGTWHVEDVQFGRWTLDETAENIFKAVEKYKPMAVGIEKGIGQQAVMNPLNDLMRRTHRVFRIELLTHGNQRKQDRILWALQGRFEHGKIKLKKADWNLALVDEASAFPSQLVHDDLLDALAYIDQMAIVPYGNADDYEDDYEYLDEVAGY
jgi:predicted phage terminase large subunit-like protein